MEPNDPALKDRLVGLRLQKSELEQDIARLQDAQATTGFSLSADKLGKLSMEMRKRLAEGPPELRQAYMRLLLVGVTVGHHEVRLEGSPAILEKLAQNALLRRAQKISLLHRDGVPERIRTSDLSFYCGSSTIFLSERPAAWETRSATIRPGSFPAT